MKKRSDTAYNQYMENLKINLRDDIESVKRNLPIGAVVRRRLKENTYEKGEVIQKFEHVALCRSTNDQYNLSFSYMDIALGLAEVIK